MQRLKNRQKNKDTIKLRGDVTIKVAEIHGVTADFVRKVIQGNRENEEILLTYMELLERDSLLLLAVKKAVPFNTNQTVKTIKLKYHEPL